MFLEILIIAVLTLVNGLLAMSELAVVSSRPARLKVLAADGRKGAETAIRLTENPGRFLSSVQIGITLVGVLSGAFSGATLGSRLASYLATVGVPLGAADALGVGIVVVIITYLSLIIGELVPKQIALRDPEGIATRVAPAMAMIATIAAPLVWLLDVSGKAVLAAIGQGGEQEEKVTEEEVKTIIAEAESAGVLESDERSMITGVMRLADRSARGLMTPRRDVELIDLSDDPDEIRKTIRQTHRSRLPVQDGDADTIIGVLAVKDLVEVFAEDKPLDIRKLVQPAPVVMDRTDALGVVRALRASVVHMALVFDEYGHFEGIVTSGDLLEAITGVFQEEEGSEPAVVQRDDGSFLVSGWMPVDEFSDRMGIAVPRDAKYETVAGYVLSQINHLPAVGETFERGEWKFEVVDLDGRRIDKILMSRMGE
ncbi:hemolysin family protein [Paradevosia shaoguanensis]|uniref:Hemolysin family protein n=1 Tax=Paradevosia shaoguanensis TaxID=1335043 RepID=A0AA41QL22_9HYPH|nr:hemolysin family protein [Paradevosia shaoguanensis]MCF1742091.1 hemolysin family protein [Paradevosia shaoguanensis]MCI0126574.1 hemolysin family protein [Paradevosia shaoguanensis]CDP52417.1 Hemolysins and related proteins containing CBS dom ains [Devosia sp. DBB001]